MEHLALHLPEAATPKVTQFVADHHRDIENEDLEAREISQDAELNFSEIAKTDFSIFADRNRHIFITGRTGMGKSTLLERIVVQDIDLGRQAVFIDPHGQSALSILNTIRPTRRICYFDLSNPRSIRWNPIAGYRVDEASLVASNFIDAIKEIFFDRNFNAPRFTHYLRNFLVPLIEKGNATLMDLMRMLSDEQYRTLTTETIADPLSRLFWKKGGEYSQAGKKYNAEAIAPIANKLSQILSNPTVRFILDTRSPTFTFSKGYSLVANLAKGTVGKDASRFVGSLLVAQARNHLFSQPTEKPKPFCLTTDEFQNYAVDTFDELFSEGRKYGLWLTTGNQFTSQVPPHIFDAIMGNAGTIISFQVSPKDADLLAPQFDTRPHQPFSPSRLTQLDPFHAMLRTTDIAAIRTLPPPPPTGRFNKIVTQS